MKYRVIIQPPAEEQIVAAYAWPRPDHNVGHPTGRPLLAPLMSLAFDTAAFVGYH